jgi:predicted HTH transcriptional regulator
VPNDFEETVVAFLNYSEGGEIFDGVGNLDLVQRQIADRIKNNIQPHTLGLFGVLVEKIDNIEVIKVIVSSGIDKPYYLHRKGMSPEGCFIRVGSSIQHMTKEQIEATDSVNNGWHEARKNHAALANASKNSLRLTKGGKPPIE